MRETAQPGGVRSGSFTLSPCHLVTLSLLLVAGCNWPGQPNPGDQPLLPDQVVKFETLFQNNCAGCHGADGKMGPAPALNDALFLAIVPDEDLLMTITEGRPKTPMPAFAREKGGPLTSRQVQVLAEGLKPRWGKPGKSTKGVPDYELPKKGGDKKAGAAVFARACAGCHGADGSGKEKIGAVHNRDFLALTSDQALRRIVITGRPDLGMPSLTDPEEHPKGIKPLSSQDVNDLVALLTYWRVGGSINGK